MDANPQDDERTIQRALKQAAQFSTVTDEDEQRLRWLVSEYGPSPAGDHFNSDGLWAVTRVGWDGDPTLCIYLVVA